jgi:hypothetical protein
MTVERQEEWDASQTDCLSRRRVLVQSTAGAMLACALSGCATSSKAQGNTPREAAKYQDHPSGLERCGVCNHFIPLSGCEVVAAPVQSNGWCQFYALFG